ncbi:CinA family protein [Streptomyces sp. MUM 203J]|uniref:CinA family protein n=1 Tax=Streptomyces sp. MUM 203J TaxID=2791990 RepID=UPI001F042E68
MLAERGRTLAVAESLTGGLVAAELTSVPGASAVFRGSVTAYATGLKHLLLGVDRELLDQRGAVDAEVALQMARGVRSRLGADWGVATTGVAGPEPQDGQPVGTVYVAVCGPSAAGAAGGKVAALRLNGDRAEIRRESVRSALELLADEIGHDDVHEGVREDVNGRANSLPGELPGNARAKDTEQNGGN